MKKKLARMLLLFGAIVLISGATPGCKSKVKDADVKTAVEAAIATNPDLNGLMVDVKDGIATVTGEVKDAVAQAAVQTSISAVKGVKSVQNNVTIAAPPPPAPVEITADDPLTSAVKDATKDFPGVTATVKDGVISVSGELKSDAWKKLKMALDGLKPKKVDASGLKIAK
jgi:hyperosmotically inducible protein